MTALVADEMVKVAEVHLVGIETTGNENLQIRVEGTVGAVVAALAAAEVKAANLGTRAITNCLPRPAAALQPLLDVPNSQNPLYGGRDQFLPSDFPSTQPQSMNGNEQ